jgi:aspartyl-tRNA(Asn)/glutamyl-tRNA(Gln) amidotransferase subunit C
MSLTSQDVKKIGRLSRIALSDDDIVKCQKELEGIFGWIDQLQSIDVSSVELEADCRYPMHERPDLVVPNANVQDVLANAPKAQHDMFVVPKVVE